MYRLSMYRYRQYYKMNERESSAIGEEACRQWLECETVVLQRLKPVPTETGWLGCVRGWLGQTSAVGQIPRPAGSVTSNQEG